MPLAGHLRHFLKSWKILIRDQEILSAVKGHNIVLTTILHQEKIPGHIYMGGSTEKPGKYEHFENVDKGTYLSCPEI